MGDGACFAQRNTPAEDWSTTPKVQAKKTEGDSISRASREQAIQRRRERVAQLKVSGFSWMQSPQVQRAKAALAQGKCEKCEQEEKTVQRSENGSATNQQSVGEIAASGFQGGARSLPHLNQIGKSFGRDMSHVQAYVGGAAAKACDALGASAYASGNQIAFKSAPDVGLAAHEAAHVVQQASGKVQLSGGMGQVGDKYENHADRVARETAVGRSAEGLLQEFSNGSSSKVGKVQAKAQQNANKQAGSLGPPTTPTAPPSPPATNCPKPNVAGPSNTKGQFNVNLGYFEVNTKRTINRANVSVNQVSGIVGGLDEVNIEFYANQQAKNTQSINLTQIVRTTRNGQPVNRQVPAFDQSRVPNTPSNNITYTTVLGDTLEAIAKTYYGNTQSYIYILEANMNLLSTNPQAVLTPNMQITVPLIMGDYYVDHTPSQPRTSSSDGQISQDYATSMDIAAGKAQHGSKTGNQIKKAFLKDTPLTPDPLVYEFETIARDVDNGIYYGSLIWGFSVNSCLYVDAEKTPTVIPGASETFAQALAEFNKYYRNEHIVVEGETLGDIAQRYYGNSNQWQDILKANQDRLPNNIIQNSNAAKAMEIRPAGQAEILLRIPTISAP